MKRDYGEKSEKHLSSLLAFLNNWLNFRVQGQFEIKMLTVLDHSDINTYFIWIKNNDPSVALESYLEEVKSQLAKK